MVDLSDHGIVTLIKNQAGQFLLLEDGREAMLGHWAPPHGRCESTDASEEAAVIREVKEETGLDVRPVKKLLTQPADTKVKTVSFWEVALVSGTVMLDDESSGYGWFTVGEALKQLKLYPGAKTFFQKLNKQT